MNIKLFNIIRSFNNTLKDRRGSPTVEYIMLMVCGTLLVSILYTALASDQVQESVIKKVEEVIAGQTQIKSDINTIPSLNSSYPSIPTSENSISNKNSPLIHSQPPTQDTPPPTPSKSFFGGMIDGVKSFGNTIWDSTKNVASSMWNGTKQAASSVWNWTKENKEYVAGGATVLAGAGLLFVAPLIGTGILVSAGLGAGISWLMGSDPKTIAKDAAIGGFAGLISMGVGGAVTSSIRAGTAGLLSKLSPFFQKFLPLSFGGGAAGATDSAIWDKLKNGAVNWKNALLSAAIGIGLVFGGGQLIEKAPSIVSQINKLPANPFEQLSPALAFEGGGSSVSKTIGDTGFGQWLQKFTTSGDGTKSPKVVKNNDFIKGSPEHKAQRWKEYQEQGGKMSYGRWSNLYEANMGKSSKSHQSVEKYKEKLTWNGSTQVHEKTPFGRRYLDIANRKKKLAIEHKTTTKSDGSKGYFSRSPRIHEEIEKDAYLVAKGWDITWVFEKADASEPLIQELKKSGIKIKFEN
ncbi:hypothetical protein [Shimazuella kribbensis]|uniref:hypothetical protein n=1 Tax=Shimazuella kribbensis TaxID=139808 RepID=UPI00048EFB0A|nr:hypothetical protein [Shimazuella kribbensis]